MKLSEVADEDWDDFEDPRASMSWFGFRLAQEEEREEDNRKIYHTMTLPNGKQVGLDHSPYQWITQDVFRRYVMFYKEHGRFPNRSDIGSNGPLRNDDVVNLTR